jgi:DNA invertase Pin-like site-specific DNA recombinase
VKLNLGGVVYNPTDPAGRLLFNVLAMVAEFEPDIARARTRDRMAVPKAKRRLRGKLLTTSGQQAHLSKLHDAGEHTSAELAELFGLARSTVYRTIQRVNGRRAGGGELCWS